MQRGILFICLLTCCLTSCLKKVEVGNFNVEEWKKDKNGCLELRPNLIDELNQNKKAFLGLYQKDILDVFGQPEEQELYKRSQTYYVYYIDAASGCPNPVEDPRKLFIRFTSLGIANEVTIR